MSRLLPFLCVAVLTAGCGTPGVMRTLFTGVTAADAEFEGFKVGPAIPAAAAVNPEVAGLVAQSGGLAAFGVLMPVAVVGEDGPRWVYCTDELAVKCQQIRVNSKVMFSGQPKGPLWKPSRLTAEGFDD